MRTEISSSGELLGVTGVYVYQGQQFDIPLRYAFYSDEFKDFGTGLEAGAFFMPRITQGDGGLQFEENGVALYLSKRTVQSQLARLYLFGEEDEYFKIAHIEDDFLISQLKSNGLEIGNFASFRGFRGPIKIWEVSYPNIELNEEFLDTFYPPSLRIAG